jgi:hypothetical protein
LHTAVVVSTSRLRTAVVVSTSRLRTAVVSILCAASFCQMNL